MKQKILERLKAEVNASKRYAENWVKKAKKEKLDQPLTFLDIAVIAKNVLIDFIMNFGKY